MHDPINPGNLSQSASEHPDQLDQQMEMQRLEIRQLEILEIRQLEILEIRQLEILDQRITRALETIPEPHIPAGFASRVASQLPARRPDSLTPTYYGQKAVLICMLATLAALIVLAVHTTGHATFGLLESLLFTQFIALTVWLSVWRHGLR